MPEAEAWRRGTQRALTTLMDAGFRVDGFARVQDDYAYRLTRAAANSSGETG